MSAYTEVEAHPSHRAAPAPVATAEDDWATYRDIARSRNEYSTARRSFMAGRESGMVAAVALYESGRKHVEAVKPSAAASALVRASSWLWGLSIVLGVTAGIVGIVAQSLPWCVAALVGAFVAVFAVVARMSDGDDREAVKAALVVAGAFLYVALLAGTAVAVVIVGWRS